MRVAIPAWQLLILISLTASGCQALVPVETPVEEQSVLFQDDFSDPLSGWRQLSPAGGSAAYADGVYQVKVEGANADVWTGPGKSFADVRVEVDAIKTPGERNNRFGIICRMTDMFNFYVFLVSSDGFYGIGKVIDNQPTLIEMDSLLPSEKIPQGSGLTHLRADCIGDRLVLYVNGEKIHEARDEQLASGDIGLLVGSYSPQGTEILFDNLQVYAP